MKDDVIEVIEDYIDWVEMMVNQIIEGFENIKNDLENNNDGGSDCADDKS